MEVRVIEEAGYDSALRGMSYSFKDRAEEVESWWETKRERAISRAGKLAPMDGGHNKFLESIQVWVDIEAPRLWWSEFDTYRAGVTKQSESTMHTLSKRPPTYDDFDPATPVSVMNAFIDIWEHVKGDIYALKAALPEGFLQRRLVCTNYKSLRHIINQRKGHRLTLWKEFEDEILSQLQHPELIKE